ncbi:cytochrome d ubiquinol oxidase subunit II [Natrialba sp. PRR66]|uniref:cytochrome d ubiquinol oxidase subunit II n=1 Tax=Natrialba sp. PRR66 TaxID=3098146 RepID=UPI002B1D486A|nr:cytochrome d ubiquinol oxidase subunit II [Natrialba sp. PRR66]
MTELVSTAAVQYPVESLPELWFAFVFAVLGAYLLLDGFDFGVGMLYAQADGDERETMHAAFGPVWKANEVWLVLFGTVLFAAFPAVYANLLSRHYLLIFAILAALVLRGIGSKLREERDSDRWHRVCDRSFVAGSTLAPFFLGMLVANWRFGLESTVNGTAIAVGLLLVTLSIVLGASFLTIKTRGDLRRTMRRYGRLGSVGYVAVSLATIGYIALAKPGGSPVPSTAETAVAVGGTIAFAALGIVANRRRRDYGWALSVAGLALVFVGYLAWTMRPFIDPAAALSIREAVVSPVALEVNSIVAVTFVPLIIGYFVLLYSVFSGPATAGDY